MYTREHYFDHIDLSDPRMLRTPFLFQRVDYYINKLQVRHPDTLAQAIDEVLRQMEPAEETYQVLPHPFPQQVRQIEGRRHGCGVCALW